MIAANKKLLNASLTEGVLTLQSQLIDLYTNNLNVLATQFALIMGFTSSSLIGNRDAAYPDNYATSYMNKALCYCFMFFLTFCFITGSLVLVQCSVVTIFGPAKALKGDTSDKVKAAADRMRKYLKEIAMCAVASLISLWISALCFTWLNSPHELAAALTFLYIVGAFGIVVYARRALEHFLLNESDITKSLKNYQLDIEDGIAEASNNAGSNSIDANNRKKKKRIVLSANEEDLQEDTLTMTLNELSIMKFKGYIWKRRTLAAGGTFKRVFAVIENLNLDIYKSETQYNNHKAPLNESPYRLREHTLELDTKRFQARAASLRKTLVGSALGSTDFDLGRSMLYHFDRDYSLRYLRFALEPKIQTELRYQETLEFLCESDLLFTNWVTTLQKLFGVTRMEEKQEAYTVGNPTVEYTVRTGVTDVQTAIRAANADNKV